MHNTICMRESAPGATEPNKDVAPGVMAESFRDEGQKDGADFPASEIAKPSMVIEGEAYALAWIERPQAGMAQPCDLAALLSLLHGEMLHGACRLIEKALECRSHG